MAFRRIPTSREEDEAMYHQQQPGPSYRTPSPYEEIQGAMGELLQRRLEHEATLSRQSSSSSGSSGASTIVPLRNDYQKNMDEAKFQQMVEDTMEDSLQDQEEVAHFEPDTRPMGYQPYQPGQFLPTIVTGETLQIEDLPRDPFTDAQTPRGPPQDLPFRPPSQPYMGEQYMDEEDLPLTQRTPGYGYTEELPLSQPYTYTYEAPDYAQESPERPISSHSRSYQQQHSSPGSLDHFSHDAEAYASGNYSRASYRPPRSRSPTPAVDDEDYQIVGDESIHYTGYSQKLNLDSIPYEPEKEAEDLADYPYARYFPPAPPTSQMLSQIEKTPSAFDTPETPAETRHFGPAPTGRIHRRNKSKKRVQLTNGNLVVELPVPPKLVLPRRGDQETTQTRYTAVTCDPDDFEKKGFFLRQNETGRKTELFIVVTMYNEDEVLFCRTLYGVMRNISHLCSRKNSQTWGPDAWKKVVVCIVSDGRKKVHPRVLDCLTLLGVYQPGDHMKNMVNNKEVTAHLFEYTTSFGLDPNLHFRYPDKGIVPTQIIFCMKEKNMKKINSHRWFFNAFAPLLQPNVCVLLDVGTRPGNNSIYRLWKAFDVNSSVGGACGEIATYKGKRWTGLLNPLVAAQNFEYKMSGILDKTTESMFGYISVLPGAFSAYRYIALQNDKMGFGPLASYFKGEVLHGRDTDIFTSNMYLAEDRILCFELVAKANSAWILKYVKGSVGETDVPDNLPEFISQRRRWLNGSFFAAVYAIAHTGQIMRSGHSIARKVVLLIETVYSIINLVFSWFSVGNFYLFFVVLTSSLEAKVFGIKGIQYVNMFLQYTMAAIVVACFLFSMGNKPQASPWKYKMTALLLAVLMAYMLVCSALCAIQAAKQGGSANDVMVLSLLVTFGLYAFSSVLAFDPWHLLTSFLPYMLLSPTYINILNIYAFSNLDDISWGTKQDSTVERDLGAVIQDSHSNVDVEMLTEAADFNSIYEEAIVNLKTRKAVSTGSGVPSLSQKEEAAKDYYANVRTNLLLFWVFSNTLLLLGILGGGPASTDTFARDSKLGRTKAYMIFVLVFAAMQSIIRFTGSTLYLIVRVFTG